MHETLSALLFRGQGSFLTEIGGVWVWLLAFSYGFARYSPGRSSGVTFGF